MISQMPFLVWGEGDAPFYCLGYMDGIYRMTRGSQPATQGIYFCPSPQFSTLSLYIFAEDGHLLLYERGDDNLNTIEFVLLELFRRGIDPYFWHLFPREEVVIKAEHQEQYEQHRIRLSLLIHHFRNLNWMEMEILKKRVTPKFNAAPDAKAPYLTEENNENEELIAAAMTHVKDNSED